jgi:hypothetical protein
LKQSSFQKNLEEKKSSLLFEHLAAESNEKPARVRAKGPDARDFADDGTEEILSDGEGAEALNLIELSDAILRAESPAEREVRASLSQMVSQIEARATEKAVRFAEPPRDEDVFQAGDVTEGKTTFSRLDSRKARISLG